MGGVSGTGGFAGNVRYLAGYAPGSNDLNFDGRPNITSVPEPTAPAL